MCHTCPDTCGKRFKAATSRVSKWKQPQRQSAREDFSELRHIIGQRYGIERIEKKTKERDFQSQARLRIGARRGVSAAGTGRVAQLCAQVRAGYRVGAICRHSSSCPVLMSAVPSAKY